MNGQLPQTWDDFLCHPFSAEPYAQVLEQIEKAYQDTTVFPPRQKLFAAFDAVSPTAIRAVILGQDPYHAPGQATGLAFAVSTNVKLPPSLRNIFTELCADMNLPMPTCGDLQPWAKQGVLLLNTVLTVQAGEANSHKDIGWQRFTDHVICALAALPQPIAFVLWGTQAQKKIPMITKSKYPRLVLQAPHPSPLSSYRGFFGSKPFSAINHFLERQGQPPIDWQLP